MRDEYLIPGTAGTKIVYDGQVYTLSEDIQYTLDAEDDRPVEPRAQLVTSDGTSKTAYWYLPDTEALDRWSARGDYSRHVSGVVTCE
jgi:hypothetical protein|nr:MAG TPA_asm: hypothetical protein [Caudoviricetes sp.]